jgi:hypothetical protein
LQAQTLQKVCPVSDGEFFSAWAGEFEDPLVVGSPALEVLVEDVPEVVVLVDPVEPTLAPCSPGDTPGGMNGDCGALVT